MQAISQHNNWSTASHQCTGFLISSARERILGLLLKRLGGAAFSLYGSHQNMKGLSREEEAPEDRGICTMNSFLQVHSLWRCSPSSQPSGSHSPASARFSMWLQCCSSQRTRTLAADLQDLLSSWEPCGLDPSLLHARYSLPSSPHCWIERSLHLLACDSIPLATPLLRSSPLYCQQVCFPYSVTVHCGA